MVLNKKFQHQPSAVASYNWETLIGGKGYKTLYGTKDDNGTLLLEQPVNSGVLNITTLSADLPLSTPAKMVDLDFDTKFDVPQIIDGVIVINGTLGYDSSNGGGTGTAKLKLVVQALKNGVHVVSGSTLLTDVGGVADNTASSIEVSLNMDMPKTPYAIGDTLRFTCEVWGYDTKGGGSTDKCSLAHDGGDRNDDNTAAGSVTILDAHSTQLKFFTPFQIDL